ncbi:MAG TPA: ABC transporter ATP-binding protein [Gemmatimonadaceae bacterium]|nr:ABC transporter ATP-binding protein [Gemmatimonadaceae bacterium]
MNQDSSPGRTGVATTAGAERTAASEIAIRVQALTRAFGEHTAVDSITFDVDRGELFGLVGPDGAGKTTTLRMLAGVMRPTAGDAVVDGVSVATNAEAAKHHLAYMPQRFGLYADLTVLENLMFYADLFQVPKSERAARLERLFTFSNLGPFQARLAGNLSGGMKQKLALSCALIHQPRVLLLDEPTFGVDPISRRDLWLIVHEMVAQGVTVVVSTAYMDEAERFDRLALLHKGRVLAVDTPRALEMAIGGSMLSVDVDNVRAARDVLARQPFARRVTVFGDRLHVSVADAAAAADVASVLRQAGHIVGGIQPVAASLEDVFIDRIATPEAA